MPVTPTGAKVTNCSKCEEVAVFSSLLALIKEEESSGETCDSSKA